ncbi:MAG: type I polyketide synthase, partial [Gammaproteobacteria bacterium]|nr:type I polyketide synthase [Gammaproteobacteria bacterium]
DKDRIIARLPGPPYQFLDRIISIEDCEQWVLKPGGRIIAEYDVPADAWYFQENRQGSMPFSVLLEVALQPCGWLAAYLGSALTSEVDLSFRNLGGKAEQLLLVTPDTGTLTTHVTITQVSTSGGMIIQNYDYEVRCRKGIVYKGDTYFGFFSKQSLANQVGIREAALHQPTDEEMNRANNFNYLDSESYPAEQMRMVDTITHYDPEGGPAGLGFIKGTAKVRPDAWFFKAHFYQDPVWPGSLGLESFIQLLKVIILERWGNHLLEFESMALNQPHEWLYRGQIIPGDDTVTIEAMIKHIDNERKMVTADGFLSVDGRTIYQMTDFTLRISTL